MSGLAQTSTTPMVEARSKVGVDFEKMPLDEVLTQLAAQPERGLSSIEAGNASPYGPNALVEKQVSLIRKIFGYFSGPIAYMIERPRPSRLSSAIGMTSPSSPGCCSSMPRSNSGRTGKPPMR